MTNDGYYYDVLKNLFNDARRTKKIKLEKF